VALEAVATSARGADVAPVPSLSVALLAVIELLPIDAVSVPVMETLIVLEVPALAPTWKVWFWNEPSSTFRPLKVVVLEIRFSSVFNWLTSDCRA
jgi:hypothetical protein